jgi:hypothetical protein
MTITRQDIIDALINGSAEIGKNEEYVDLDERSF